MTTRVFAVAGWCVAGVVAYRCRVWRRLAEVLLDELDEWRGTDG